MNRYKNNKNDRKLEKIFLNHFEEFRKTKLPKLRNKEMRKHIVDTVEKALRCGDIKYGYAKHKCLTCDEEYIHGFSCKSKFCTKCGRMYSIKWAEKQASNMLNTKHRHAVFTIPQELRNYFYKKRTLLKDMQDAVNGVISSYYKNKVKGNIQVGLITVIHTFGSDLKWNPHVHALFTEGGIDRNNKWFKKVQHIPYKYLRKSWQKLVLDIIKKNFEDRETKKLINRLYKKYKEGFYVNAQRNLTNIKYAAKYIGRYLARPAIAEYRITDYDGKDVTFWYENKEPKERITIKISAIDFIGKLVNHIHPKGFRSVRRYGIYSRTKNKLSIEILKLYNFVEQGNISDIIKKTNYIKRSFKEWLIDTFNENPFKCTKCGDDMILWEVWHYKYGTIYDVLDKSNYRNIIDDDIEKNQGLKTEIKNIYDQIELF